MAVEPPDHEIHQRHKRRMQRRVVMTLLGAALLYFAFLLPDPLVQKLAERIGTRESMWVRIGGAAIGTPSLAAILSFLLFASDSLVKGSGKTARWFRSLFASRAAAERFACSQAEAAALWFRYFDTWAISGSPNGNLLVNSYSATYSARAIFYLQRALILFLLLGSLSMFIGWKALGAYDGADGRSDALLQGVVLVVYLLVYAFIWATNRVPAKGRPPTGCWARVEDVFSRSKVAFTQDVLRHVATLDEAFAQVARIRDDLLHEVGAGGVAAPLGSET